MKKTKIVTIFIFLMIIAVCIILLFDIFDESGSNNVNTDSNDDPVFTVVPDDDKDNDNTDSDNTDPDNPNSGDSTDNLATPIPNTIELNLYTIDYDTMECIPNSVVVDETFQVNAGNIVNKVIEDFLESPVIIKCEENEDNVVVYFDSEKPPLVNVSEDMEMAMLDSIAYSLIDNLTNCTKVYFRTDAGDYKSDNLLLDYDEPYLSSEIDE